MTIQPNSVPPVGDEGDAPEQVYHPNAIPGSAGLGCFIAQERICGPDCMAYLLQAPSGQQYQGEQWAHCLLLVNAERAGKHLVIVVDLVKQGVSLLKQAGAVKARSEPAPGVR